MCHLCTENLSQEYRISYEANAGYCLYKNGKYVTSYPDYKAALYTFNTMAAMSGINCKAEMSFHTCMSWCVPILVKEFNRASL